MALRQLETTATLTLLTCLIACRLLSDSGLSLLEPTVCLAVRYGLIAAEGEDFPL